VGLFDRMKDPVRGTANVVSATPLDRSSHGTARCTMELIVQADGLTPTAVTHRDDDTPVERWPSSGAMLPVTVDREKPERLRVEWDEAPMANASALAAVPTPSPPPAEHHSIRDEHPEIPPEAAAIVDQLTSMFPGATVNVAEPTVVHLSDKITGDASTVLAGLANALGEGDEVSQLERLAKLHESGALTDGEFAEAKAKLLGGGAPPAPTA
jgi:hypothetical protein